LCSYEVAPFAAFHALNHEPDEILLPDIPRPLKHAPEMAWYRDTICVEHARVFSIAFGLAWPWPEDIEREVHRADAVLLATEARDLFDYREGDPGWFLTEKPSETNAIETVWEPDYAEAEFLKRFAELDALRKSPQ
jgi:hypothetical protein